MNEKCSETVMLTKMPQTTELKKKRQFKKFTYRGIDLDQYVRPCFHLRSRQTNVISDHPLCKRKTFCHEWKS